jgi:hypothetical protein
MGKRTPFSATGVIAAVLARHSLADVTVLLDLHDAETSRPRRRSIRNAAAVMLVAHWEAFIENVFEYTIESRYASETTQVQAAIIKYTTHRFHNASSHHINMLFLNVGIANILDRVKWQGMTPSRAKKRIDEIVESRNFLAHGQRHTRQPSYPTAARLRGWVQFIDNASDAIAHAVQSHVSQRPARG